MHIPVAVRTEVIGRARHRCEYCLVHEDDAVISHELDHIVASKHRGVTTADNLAYTCFPCNRYKGSDLSSIDPVSGQVARFFNPRTDYWEQHFSIRKGIILPRSDIGRVTTQLLRFNLNDRIFRRQALYSLGRWPG